MLMERDKLVEKHARAEGLGEVKVGWIKVAGPSVMNDGIISGALQFISVGAPSLITLWDKTKDNVQIKGMSALTTYPLYLNVRNPNIKSIRDFSDKDKIAVPSVKISTQAIMLQMAAAKEYGDQNYAHFDPWTVGLSHPDALLAFTNNDRWRRRAFRHVAVSRAGDEGPGHPDADHQLRDPRRAGDRARHRRIDQVSRGQSEELQGVLRRAEGSDRHHQQGQARRRQGLSRAGEGHQEHASTRSTR